MEWKRAKVPAGCRLFQIHNYAFMHGGNTYLIEIDEFSDGTYSAHGEHSTDKSMLIETVSGKSERECLEGIMSKIESRIKGK